MTDLKSIEVRGFMQLDAILRKKYGTMPFYIDISEPISGIDLAEKLEIAIEEVEVIFVNGSAQALSYIVNPGDRVAFLPPGCPGPYRVALGFYAKNKQ